VAGRELIVADDPGAFAASLQQLASDSVLRGRLVEGGRARLRSLHDPELVADQLTAIYRTL
jgi:glycosyltransferase involved in cell wall biosynthesis